MNHRNRAHTSWLALALPIVVPAFLGLCTLFEVFPVLAENNTQALAFHFRTCEPESCGWDVEHKVEEALEYWDIIDPCIQRETLLDDYPEITIDMLRDNLPGKRVALLSTHGSFGDPDIMAGEYYLSYSAMDDAYYSYTNGGGYDYTELRRGIAPHTPDTSFTIGWTNEGIRNHLRTMAANAIVYGDYCDSYYQKDDWNVDTYIGYEYSPGSGYACDNLKKVWTRLGCQWAWDLSGWPFHGHQTDDAVQGLPAIGLWPPDSKNQLDPNRGCHNIAATFEAVGVFDETFFWQTLSEVGSVDFVVRGYPPVSAGHNTRLIVL